MFGPCAGRSSADLPWLLLVGHGKNIPRVTHHRLRRSHKGELQAWTSTTTLSAGSLAGALRRIGLWYGAVRQQTDCDGMTCPTGSQSSSSNVRPSHAERWNRVCHGVDRRFLAQVTAAVPLCCHDPALPCEMRRWLNRLPDPGLSRVWQLYTPARTARIRAAIVPPPCPPALGLQKNFVQSAYLQAVGKAKTHPIILNLTNNQTCRFDVIEPIRACYNSIVPGFLGAKQWKGQYGFYFKFYIICPKLDNPAVIWCKARSNTLRANRFGNDDYWVPQGAIFEWKDYCSTNKWPW
ncbi:hypothetical protein ABPG77_002583 [Micractinium sp. CCAP 211/92]